MTSPCFKPEKHIFIFPTTLKELGLKAQKSGQACEQAGRRGGHAHAGCSLCLLQRMALGSRLLLASPMAVLELGEPWGCASWGNSYYQGCYASMLPLFALPVFPKIHQFALTPGPFQLHLALMVTSVPAGNPSYLLPRLF